MYTNRNGPPPPPPPRGGPPRPLLSTPMPTGSAPGGNPGHLGGRGVSPSGVAQPGVPAAGYPPRGAGGPLLPTPTRHGENQPQQPPVDPNRPSVTTPAPPGVQKSEEMPPPPPPRSSHSPTSGAISEDASPTDSPPPPPPRAGQPPPPPPPPRGEAPLPQDTGGSPPPPSTGGDPVAPPAGPPALSPPSTPVSAPPPPQGAPPVPSAQGPRGPPAPPGVSMAPVNGAGVGMGPIPMGPMGAMGPMFPGPPPPPGTMGGLMPIPPFGPGGPPPPPGVGIPPRPTGVMFAPPPPLPPFASGAPPLPPGPPPPPPPGPPPQSFADDGNFLAKMLKEQEEEEKRKKKEEERLNKDREAHAKRVAEENKRSKRLTGGGFGSGHRRPIRLKVGNSRGKVVKAFAGDSDEDEEDEEDEVPSNMPTETGGDPDVDGSGAASSEAGVEGTGSGGVGGLGQALGMAGRAGSSGELSEEMKEIIKRTAGWIHSFPDKSQVVIEKSRGNPKFDFLFNKTSQEGRFYRQVMEELKTEEEVKRVCSGLGESSDDTYGAPPSAATDPGAGAAAGTGVGLSAMAAVVAGKQGVPVGGVQASSTAAAASAAGGGGAGGGGKGDGGTDRASEIAAHISAQVAIRQATGRAASLTGGTHPSSTTPGSSAGAGGADETGPSTLDMAAAAAEALRRANAGRARKSRWGGERKAAMPSAIPSATAVTSPVVPGHATGSAPAGAPNAGRGGVAAAGGVSLGKRARGFTEGGNGSEPGLALPETMDKEQEEQLRQQKEMQRLESRIREAAARQSMPGKGGGKVEGEAERRMRELYEERLMEYGELATNDDEDIENRDTVEDAEMTGGVIDGGTWEHKKRAKEMIKTAETALDLTLAAKGAHHMGQYLPKEELDKFLGKASRVTKGLPAEVEEDFAKNKLDEDNLGFQMLKKAGWTEGKGLGKDGEGTSAPVNMNMGAEGAGVGVKETHEVTEEDDEFDQYRKRMMLAYRFRPNPLNNPRRSYY